MLSVGMLVLVAVCPLPGRGPRVLQRRDPWRGFKYAARRAVMDRAGGQCEAPAFLVWGRCRDTAAEADHIYPWSKGGPTVFSNGQALCRRHNRRKSNLRPPWWYVLSLERRRLSYCDSGTEVHVLARMNPEERAARQAWADARRTKG
ncbi:HNH endonuclease [Nocardioides maradonensis]